MSQSIKSVNIINSIFANIGIFNKYKIINVVIILINSEIKSFLFNVKIIYIYYIIYYILYIIYALL